MEQTLKSITDFSVLQSTVYALDLTIDWGLSFLGVVFRSVNPFLMSAKSLSTMQPSSSDGILLVLLPVTQKYT